MADSQQGVRQQSARNISGNAGTYNEDLRARFNAVTTVPAGSTFNEAMILWLRAVTGSDSENINDLAALYADQQTDVYNWSSSPQGGEAVVMRWYPDDSASLPDTSTFARLSIAQDLTTTDATTFWYQEAQSGELRFDGQRRVKTLISTIDMSDASWIVENGAALVATRPGVGLNNETAYEFSFPSGATDAVRQTVFPLNRNVGSSFFIRKISGTGSTIRIRNGDASGQSSDITITGSFQKIGHSQNSLGSSVLRVLNGSSGSDIVIQIYYPMAELIQNITDVPSEFVAPDVTYNAEVDGVRYFAYANGNSIISGVITESNGPAITNGAFLREAAATNLQAQSTDYSSWTTTGLASANDDGVGEIGLNEYTLTEDTGNSQHRVFNTIGTVTSGTTYTTYVIVKVGTIQFIEIRENVTGASFVIGNFDLTGLSSTDNGNGSAVTRITDLGDGYRKCELTWTPTATVASTSMILMANTGTASAQGQTYTGSSRTLIACHSQSEATAFSTSPIITSGSTVTRVADSLTDTTWPPEAAALVDVTVNDPIPGSGDEMVMLGFGAGASNVFTIDAATTVSLNVGSIAASATASSSYEGERHQFGMSLKQDEGIVVDDEDNDDTSQPGGSLGDIYVGSASDLSGVPCRLHKVVILDSAQTASELKQGL